jgi:tetratricopeptide (TPR) repeat protein
MELETTESGWACNERGVAYAVNQQYDRAIADFDQAIRLTPHYSHFYNNRGIAFTEKGQYDRAIQDFDQAIRLTPNFAVPFQNRGRAFRMKGQKAQADADFTKAGQLNPNVPPPPVYVPQFTAQGMAVAIVAAPASNPNAETGSLTHDIR